MIPSASHRVGSQLSSNWIPVCFGLACLYLPTYFDLSRVFWSTREGAYSPVMLAFIVWLVWRERADNPWLTQSKEVLLRYLPAVKEDAATCGPGVDAARTTCMRAAQARASFAAAFWPASGQL